MPLFDYRCPECGRIEEVLVRRETDRVLCRNPEHYRLAVKMSEPTGPIKNFFMERLPSAPARPFAADAVHRKPGLAGIKTEVKGKLDA